MMTLHQLNDFGDSLARFTYPSEQDLKAEKAEYVKYP